MTAPWEDAADAFEALCLVCWRPGCVRLGVWVEGAGWKHVEDVRVVGGVV
jgi:hypothetical protein